MYINGFYLFVCQLSGTSEYTNAHFNSLLSLCETELARNVYTASNDTNLEERNAIIETLNNICPNDCSDHGTCSNGKLKLYLFTVEVAQFVSP